MKISVLLIGFYNEKALGVQYLANALKKKGYDPHIVFFKEFNSVTPSIASEKEMKLLENLIIEIKPSFIGLSVMSSLYLESIYMVNNLIRHKFDIPLIWGGVYPTLFPQKSMEYCNYVIRGEGEYALIELLDALSIGNNISNIENLVYRDRVNNIIVNEVRPLIQDLDQLGYPDINDENRYLICNNTITKGKFISNTYTYELAASRGCPFACSYCSSINLSRIYSKKGKYVRFRSVKSVIEELKTAKKLIKNLKLIHFWDEIFSDEEGWIEEFKEEYIKEIGLPFKIWGHPLKVNERVIKNLVEAGLNQIVVGIQSGSERVRKIVFNRPETQEQIILSSRILSKYKVPRVIYDFMLKHPFESDEDLKETYKLCLQLEPPFELQLHGLNFLPGTDITDMAIMKGILSKEELEKIMFSTIQQQYDMYWGPAANKANKNCSWLSMIYLTQFPILRPLVKRLEVSAQTGKHGKFISYLHKIMKNFAKVSNLKNKAKLIIKLK